MSSVYLESLTARLTDSAMEIPQATRELHAGYLLRLQQPDGGFPGREGESDLYYTGFALRSLVLLQALTPEVGEQAANYLKSQLSGQAVIIDFLSLLYSAMLLQVACGIDLFEGADDSWNERVLETLETFRRPDGGYAKTAESGMGSTYNSFLVVLCQQLLGSMPPEADKLASFIQSRQRDDGGFVEIEAMKRSGTNPTSAAIALLRILDALEEDSADAAIDYLLDRQSTEGGICANTRIPIADLLSTFTGLLTLSDLGAADELNVEPLLQFVRSMQAKEGGFRGAILDDGYDAEYTFYGIGAWALIQPLLKQ
ncbi:Beta-subunit of geranylgeranyltransferase or farnesyltransferase [Planctomycetales bacterium 10988]|nr:Beta-subunit of geranylgeranyltransferase or farnesyltransferase [Planctomycetales bacterium 10988]